MFLNVNARSVEFNNKHNLSSIHLSCRLEMPYINISTDSS